MSVSNGGPNRPHPEGGQVVVMFALLIPVLFALGAIVLDIGNWYIHKRHLQTQVDAAALASGPEFSWCFIEPAIADGRIRSYALQYAGDTRRDPATTNLQLQEPNDVYAVLNSSSYWALANGNVPGTNGYGLDESVDGDPTDPDLDPSNPCNAKFLDVKATDDQAPPLWGLIPLSPSPKAHAKVEVKTLRGTTGFLPWAVPENDPQTVAALFVDETDTDTVASWSFLTRPTGGSPLNGETVNVWNGPAQIDVVDETGVIILQSRDALTDADLMGQSLTDICTMPGALCLGRIRNQTPKTTNDDGIGFIFGQQGPPGNNTASVRDAELSHFDVTGGLFGGGNPSCFGQDSSPYFLWETFGNCQIRIRAQIDFGSNLPVNPREVFVQVNGAFGNNCNGGTAQLQTNNGWWESDWITIPVGSGRNEMRLCWRAGNGAQQQEGNFGNQVIQMAFSANTDSQLSGTVYSGPLIYASIQPRHSYAKATQNVFVEVGLIQPLQITTSATAPPLFIRVAGSGSLNQMLDCDPPNVGPDEEIRDGCQTPYVVNERLLSCGPPPPTWDQNNLPPTLSPDDPSWIDPDCIEANPGSVTSMAKGIRMRFEDPAPLGADCPENKWVEYRTAGIPPPASDKRLITLVIANYGEFDDQGIKPLPISKFAAFYVTGWFEGGGTTGTSGCPDNDPPPSPPYCPKSSTSPCDATDAEVQGAVWGYFVVQVDPSAGGKPSDEFCDFAELNKCIAVLVE